MSRVSFKSLLAAVLPYALIGAAEDERALLVVQEADAALNAAQEKQRVRAKKAYAADPERFKQKTREQRLRGKVVTPEQRRAKYRERHEYRLLKGVEYANQRKESGKAATYREANRDDQRQRSRERSAVAGEGYARELLAKGSGVPSKMFPHELVELKKIEIKLRRELK